MSNTLLPCPICGKEVSIALGGDGFGAWWFITRGHGEKACKCRLFMESEKFDKDSEMADFIADDLIAAWSRRAQPDEDNPLTLDELRQMDGEPVWVAWPDGRIKSRWYVVGDYSWGMMEFFEEYNAKRGCGKTWLAYRSKPKEEV